MDPCSSEMRRFAWRADLLAKKSDTLFQLGPVAQLDRASDFGSEGWGFDSLRGRHFSRSAPLSIQDIRVFLAIQSSCPWGTSTKSDFNRTSANLVPAPVEATLSRPVAAPTALKARCIRTFR